MTWRGRMNRTSNWSHLVVASMSSPTSVKRHRVAGPQESVLCRIPAANAIDWSSVLLLQYTDSLMRICSSPEPDTNCGMPWHDHDSLTGTVRGYVIVSRTLQALLAATVRQWELLRGRGHGVRSPTSNREGPILDRPPCPL